MKFKKGMKVKKSITKKLFIVTSVVFIAFITGTLIVQSLFFESFYLSKKKSIVQNNMEEFKEKYSKLKNEDEIVTLISKFEENNNFKIVIEDASGSLKYVSHSREPRKEIMKLQMIKKAILDQLNNGTTLSDLRGKGKAITFITEDRKANFIKSIVSVAYDNKKNEVIYIFSSLQPINEAGIVIKEFYLYFYIGASIIILLLSLVYSNMITKPLIRITKTASKMSQLDFSEKCIIKSEDEMGDLADALNSLSNNLDNALTSLKSANLQLEEDIEKERKLKQMRKDFVAAVSHELKTPITLIEGYTEALNDDILEGEERQYFIDVILDESRKMDSLVNDMLDLSQLESGHFSLIKEEFNLDELIKNVTKKFTGIIDERNINLSLKLIENITVNADWDRMEQVITNYITNAIRHTDSKGIINVVMEQGEENVTVSVENSGNNISESDIEKIWDNFYKVDKSRNRKLGGTGIGLAIVKNIMLLHEGSCEAQNTELGVKFKFTLKKYND